MIIFYIPNPTQYLNLTTDLIINKQQISSFTGAKVIVNGLLISENLINWRIGLEKRRSITKMFFDIYTYKRLLYNETYWKFQNLKLTSLV